MLHSRLYVCLPARPRNNDSTVTILLDEEELTFRVRLNEEWCARNETLFHSQDCLYKTRVTCCWLRVTNIALDRSDQQWFVCRSRSCENGTYAPNFSWIASLGTSTVTLEVGCLGVVRDASIGIRCADGGGLSFRTRTCNTPSSSITAEQISFTIRIGNL